jgi:translation initiation factor IF-3
MQRKSHKQEKVANTTRINEQLAECSEIRLVTEEGSEIVSYDVAIKKAREAKLDLVEVSSNQKISVCRIMDYGKYRFELLKKNKEAKKKQHVVTLKEIKIRPRIDSNDYDIKKKHAIEFLSKGDKLKITLRFKGRELAHPELGMVVVNRLIEEIKEHGTPEKAPMQEGRAIVVIINPSKH